MVKYKGKTIYDVLEMRVEEAVKFFENVPSIRKKIETLNDVGLSYLKLGHPSTLLSGGEAQRVKLATELARVSTGRTIYILDEPTTGLHTADVHQLIDVLQTLVDAGNTVLIIEHNLDVIKAAGERHNIPVLDLFAKLPIDPNVAEDGERYTIDGLHFNDAGHAVLADCLIDFLNNL